MPVVVTVTQPAVTVTATPTSSGAPSSTLSAGTIAGIVIGTLVGGVLFIILALYLLDRHSRHKFTRVVNPAHDHVSVGGAPDLRHLPSTSFPRPKYFARHSQKHSISTEPLMAPISLPPLPFTSRVQSSGTPPRSNSISPGIRDSQYSSYDLGEISISQVIGSGTVSHSAMPAILNIPPVRKPEQTSLRPGLRNTPPHTRQTSGDDVPSPSTSPKPQPDLFIHRMLRSRAQASEGVSLVRHPSLDFSTSCSTTQDPSSFRADVERLLAEAERTALRDAENAQRHEEEVMPDEDDWGEAESIESIYSQFSAPIDHSAFFSDPVSHPISSLSMPRRKSSRKQSRAPVPTELPPLAEVPDSPRAFEGQSDSRHVSTAGNSSLDRQVSHGTASRPMSSVIDLPGTLPLLTSANFGKGSTTTSGTPPGSMSSTAGWGSSSSGRTSRYPSLAPSSIGQSLRSGPRPDVGTDWRHPPPGLAGLTSLQIGSLRNPHPSVEGQPEQPDVSLTSGPANPVQAKRAHLREGTVSSMPEVERRIVMQGGIAHVDVAL